MTYIVGRKGKSTARFLWIRNGEVLEPEFEILTSKEFPNRHMHIYHLKMQTNDRLVFCSDGVTQAALGTKDLRLGLRREGLIEIVKKELDKEPNISSSNLAKRIVKQAILKEPDRKPKDDVSYVEVTLDNQYAIKENKNEIGMMYCVRVNQLIETEYGEQKKYCIAYIGFENSTNKILNISVLQFAATQTAYSDKVNNALADLDYSSLTTDSLDSFTVSGATFTTSGLKTAITTAYEIHQANGGAK